MGIGDAETCFFVVSKGRFLDKVLVQLLTLLCRPCIPMWPDSPSVLLIGSHDGGIYCLQRSGKLSRSCSLLPDRYFCFLAMLGVSNGGHNCQARYFRHRLLLNWSCVSQSKQGYLTVKAKLHCSRGTKQRMSIWRKRVWYAFAALRVACFYWIYQMGKYWRTFNFLVKCFHLQCYMKTKFSLVVVTTTCMLFKYMVPLRVHTPILNAEWMCCICALVILCAVRCAMCSYMCEFGPFVLWYHFLNLVEQHCCC